MDEICTKVQELRNCYKSMIKDFSESDPNIMEEICTKVQEVRNWYESKLKVYSESEPGNFVEKEENLFRASTRWHANSHFR